MEDGGKAHRGDAKIHRGPPREYGPRTADEPQAPEHRPLFPFRGEVGREVKTQELQAPLPAS